MSRRCGTPPRKRPELFPRRHMKAVIPNPQAAALQEWVVTPLGSAAGEATAAGLEIKHRQTGAVLLRVGADTLAGAKLRHAELPHADLRGMDLREADLSGAILSHADLTGADLSG